MLVGVHEGAVTVVTHVKKLVIPKFVLIEEYQNQLREFYCKNNYLVSMPSFNDNEGIKIILLNLKTVPKLHTNERFPLVKIS